MSRDSFRYSERYRLPIIITKRDIEIEKFYLRFYNEEYWRDYKKIERSLPESKRLDP